MTLAELRAYNAGVRDVLAIVEQSADAIERTTRRPIAEGFAIAALRELADAGRLFLKPAPRAGQEPQL